LKENPSLKKNPDQLLKNYKDDLSETHNFTPSQKLRSKFLTSAYNILHKSEEG